MASYHVYLVNEVKKKRHSWGGGYEALGEPWPVGSHIGVLLEIVMARIGWRPRRGRRHVCAMVEVTIGDGEVGALPT
jgi:hypothetical protein